MSDSDSDSSCVEIQSDSDAPLSTRKVALSSRAAEVRRRAENGRKGGTTSSDESDSESEDSSRDNRARSGLKRKSNSDLTHERNEVKRRDDTDKPGIFSLIINGTFLQPVQPFL
jgi:hypothetical protein